MKKKWVVKESGFYWEDCGDFKRSADLNTCTKFRFWIIAYLTFLDQIAYGAKIVRFENGDKRKMNFEERVKRFSDSAVKKNCIARDAVNKVTKLIQTKYPELVAEYSISDGGIIFINDATMEEYYNFEQIYQQLGRR